MSVKRAPSRWPSALLVGRAVVVLAALLSWAPDARAERSLIVPLHEGGQLVLDQLSGMRVSGGGVSYAGPAGVALRSTRSDALEPGGPASETSTTSLWLAPSVDVFVVDQLSVGGRVEIVHTWGAVEDGATRLELPGTTSMTFLPRIGFYVPLERLGIWPRVGFGWTSLASASFASTGSAPVRETLRAMLLEVDLSLVYRFTETFFMRAGPELGITLGGRRSEESNGQSAGASASMFQISGALGFGMNVEL